MSKFPATDRRGRQVPPGRVGALVEGQRAQPRGRGQQQRWGLVMKRVMLGCFSVLRTAALMRSFARKWFQQRRHFVSEVRAPRTITERDQHKQALQCGGRRSTKWEGKEPQYSNSGQLRSRAIGSLRYLIYYAVT